MALSYLKTTGQYNVPAGPYSLLSLNAQSFFCRAAEFSHTVIHKGGGLSKAPLAGGVPGGIAAGAKSPMLVSILSKNNQCWWSCVCACQAV